MHPWENPTDALRCRSIYRTIELANGWTGRIITTQVYFSQSFHSCALSQQLMRSRRCPRRGHDCPRDVLP
jgi:hypothetical protein